MIKRFTMLIALTMSCLCSAEYVQAQYGGLQVQVGSFGNGYYGGYGNGFGYGSGYGYRSGFGTPYSSGFGNYGGYGNYGRPGVVYSNRGINSGFGYMGYPASNYGYGVTRYYSPAMQRYSVRRYR